MLDVQSTEKPLTHVKSKADLHREVNASGAWTVAQIEALFDLPFNDLMLEAAQTHRTNFPEGDVELATLLSIKTGGCPEDCGYCPQAARYDTDVKASKLLDLEEVLEAAKAAKAAGSNRFCMGAAWREPKDRDIEKVTAMIKGVKALGLETCATLGMLEADQAEALQEAGLDFYNHNLDTSEDFYRSVISTRGYQDRLDTLSNVRAAGMSVCVAVLWVWVSRVNSGQLSWLNWQI